MRTCWNWQFLKDVNSHVVPTVINTKWQFSVTDTRENNIALTGKQEYTYWIQVNGNIKSKYSLKLWWEHTWKGNVRKQEAKTPPLVAMVEHGSWAQNCYSLLFSLACLCILGLASCSQDLLTNSWLVEISGGGEKAAREVAKEAGFTYVSPVSWEIYIWSIISLNSSVSCMDEPLFTVHCSKSMMCRRVLLCSLWIYGSCDQYTTGAIRITHTCRDLTFTAKKKLWALFRRKDRLR